MSDFSNPIFHDEAKAREWLEARLWPNGPICPHCGTVGEATRMKGKSHRPGLYQCNACRSPFTVTVGTLYERSKVPLHKWLAATHLMMASKKGMSALQISRMLGVPYKTAWFLCHRIRESLRETNPDDPLGGSNKVVEADETYALMPEVFDGRNAVVHALYGHEISDAFYAVYESGVTSAKPVIAVRRRDQKRFPDTKIKEVRDKAATLSRELHELHYSLFRGDGVPTP